MSYVRHIAGTPNAGEGVATGVTSFISINEMYGRPNSATEASLQTKITTAGTYSRVGIRVSANATTGASTFDFRGGAAGSTSGAQTKSIGAGATGYFEPLLSLQDTVAVNDLVNLRVVNGGGGTLTYSGVTATFIASTSANTVKRIGSGGANGFAGTSTTAFSSWGGSSTTVEADTKLTVRMACTINNLQASVDSNTRTAGDTSTYRTRKNGANGGMSLPYASAVTGLTNDNASPDSLAVNDTLDISCDQGTGTGIIRSRNTSVEFTTLDGSFMFVGGLGTGSTVALSTTQYIPCGGHSTGSTTQSNEQFILGMPIPYRMSLMSIWVMGNTVSATSTLTLQVNGVDTALTLNITASTSNTLFTSAAGTYVTVNPGDTINYKLVTGGAGTSVIYSTVSMLAQPIQSNLI